MSIQIKGRSFLDKKTKKELKIAFEERFGEKAGVYFSKDSPAERGKLDSGGNIILINKEPVFFQKDESGEWIPFLGVAQDLEMKKVTIDQPAVPYIANGADVMRPGIVQVDDDIEMNDVIAIIDEKNHVTIAIGIALKNTQEILAVDKGKVIKTVHHVGDKFWSINHP